MTTTLSHCSFFGILALLLSPVFLFGQALEVKGKVVEQNSLTLKGKTNALKGVTLQINGNTITTDHRGNFQTTIQKKENIAFIQSLETTYRIINQSSIEHQLACESSNQIFIQVELGKDQSINANFARFYQQLKQISAQSQVRWFRLFYEDKVDSISTLLNVEVNQRDIDRGFLRELFQDLESHMEYWARRLSMANLDSQSSAYKNCFNWLRNGQIDLLWQAMDKLAMNENLQNQAAKDLLVSWYTATGQFHKVLLIYRQNKERDLLDAKALVEYYRLALLVGAYGDVLEIETQLLSLNCNKGEEFLTLSHLLQLYTEQLDWGKAAKRFEQAQALWKSQIYIYTIRYEASYAEILVNMGILLYQQSDMQKAKTLVEQAIGIYEKLSQIDPSRYEGDLMRSKAVLATFYVVYQNQYAKALDILEPTLILGQRLSRLNPQLYLSEVADMYLWEGSCYKQMKQYTQAIRVYELAGRYYEQLALKNPLKLESVCGSYFLIAESYNQLLNQTGDAAFKSKGMEFIQKGLQKAIIWNRFDPIGAEMMRKNLKYYQEVFETWER